MGDVETFSKSQIERFQMESAKLVFHDDEVGMMREKIHEIFQLNYGLPRNLRGFARLIC